MYFHPHVLTLVSKTCNSFQLVPLLLLLAYFSLILTSVSLGRLCTCELTRDTMSFGGVSQLSPLSCLGRYFAHF
ncbi:hypothetical protein BDQ12DRAFT_687444 [Crucibulum laeve]|uniref:Uncharacterized protein n=1 Tax=Crucibulum laeve TaxID=68775 RepID=A0A5C3LSR2_9AGAR|nr:hypothetical protein BDQ12DRAFT_687444 [Crucibulum laeve]